RVRQCPPCFAAPERESLDPPQGVSGQRGYSTSSTSSSTSSSTTSATAATSTAASSGGATTGTGADWAWATKASTIRGSIFRNRNLKIVSEISNWRRSPASCKGSRRK